MSFKILSGLLLTFAASAPAHAGDTTAAGTAAVTALSSRWFAVEAPLAGDDNQNGYTLFEIGTGAGGPFSGSAVGYGKLPGPGEWRTEVFGGGPVAPGGTYFVRVTWVDPDGVTGTNPQVVGPITTPTFSPNAVTLGTATAEARNDEIFVSLPISGDDNRSSFGTVDVALSPGGPWTRECGSTFENNLPFHPKRCRVRGLTPGTDYWVRVTITDSDGVVGTNPQILGPIRYSGLRNLALGRPISADPGWGCCPSPSHLVDGRIQNDAWFFGFAWTGGNSRWAGGPAGFKQATIDLGAPTTFNRAIVWYHDPSSVPTVWKFQYGNDGVSWTDAHSETQPVCRTAADPLPGAWYYPACSHDATFPPVTARYFRFTFDDRTLFGGLHGWAVEIEVFDAPPANEPPSADAGPDQDVSADAACFAEVTLDGAGSSDPDGDLLTFTWTGPFGTAGGESPTVTLPPGAHTVTLTVDDGNGGTDSDEVVITVRDTTPPALSGVPAPLVAECAGSPATPVTVPLPTAEDNCDGTLPVTSDAPASFPLGTTTVHFTAADSSGNTAEASTTVTVADTTPPAIASVAATPSTLWPPNHKMRPVAVTASAADVCDAAPPVCRLISVTSNEPVNGLGDSDQAPDWRITGDLTASLRAERSGTGTGRLYVLTLQCADGAGNASSSTAAVSVRHP